VYLRVLISGCRNIHAEEGSGSGGELFSAATYPYFIVVHSTKVLVVTFRNGHIIASLFFQRAMTSKGQLTGQQFLKHCGHVCHARWEF